jgi:hypothetical protein
MPKWQIKGPRVSPLTVDIINDLARTNFRGCRTASDVVNELIRRVYSDDGLKDYVEWADRNRALGDA